MQCGLLAQLVERGANNAKVVSSILTQTMFVLLLFILIPDVYNVYMGFLSTDVSKNNSDIVISTADNYVVPYFFYRYCNIKN